MRDVASKLRSFIPLFVAATLLAPAWAGAQSRLPRCAPGSPARWTNCQGAATLPGGEKYLGEFQDGKFSGQGAITLADGDRYVGTFVDNLKSGKGLYVWADGHVYFGEFALDKRSGLGMEVLADGEKYAGEFRNDARKGSGVLDFADGDRYIGGFQDGVMSGEGVYAYVDGSKYVGEFANGLKNGRGTMTRADGETYAGEFKGDLMNGRGLQKWPHGEVYEGEFKDGKRDGAGALKYADGAVFEGAFRNDELSEGKLTKADGATYVGPFAQGKREGAGVEILPTGEKYVGDFSHDEKSGHGAEDFVDGSKYLGAFANGHFEGVGVFVNRYGDRYVGGYKDGKRSGRGNIAWSIGNRYIGEFDDDLPNGRGIFTWADGERYVGEFKQGARDGRGTMYAADGAAAESGVWSGGYLVEAAAPKAPPTPEPSPPAAAAAPEKRVALIIGNGDYGAQAPLRNPVNDANLLAASFRAAGFQAVTVKTNLSRDAMMAEIHDFAAIADDADWAVVYYSGHGLSYEGVNYMIPVDAKLRADRDVELEAIDIGKLFASIEGARKLRLVILDMCRSNPFVPKMRRSVASRSIGRGLAPVENDSGVLTVFAAKDGQEALDGEGQNSPFAEAVAKYIASPHLEIRRLFDFVRDDVMETTHKSQQPFVYGSLPGREDFYFANK